MTISVPSSRATCRFLISSWAMRKGDLLGSEHAGYARPPRRMVAGPVSAHGSERPGGKVSSCRSASRYPSSSSCSSSCCSSSEQSACPRWVARSARACASSRTRSRASRRPSRRRLRRRHRRRRASSFRPHRPQPETPSGESEARTRAGNRQLGSSADGSPVAPAPSRPRRGGDARRAPRRAPLAAHRRALRDRPAVPADVRIPRADHGVADRPAPERQEARDARRHRAVHDLGQGEPDRGARARAADHPLAGVGVLRARRPAALRARRARASSCSPTVLFVAGVAFMYTSCSRARSTSSRRTTPSSTTSRSARATTTRSPP